MVERQVRSGGEIAPEDLTCESWTPFAPISDIEHRPCGASVCEWSTQILLDTAFHAGWFARHPHTSRQIAATVSRATGRLCSMAYLRTCDRICLA